MNVQNVNFLANSRAATAAAVIYGPKLEVSQYLHKEKYQLGDEGFVGCVTRNAAAISDGVNHYEQLLDALLNMRILLAGRLQSGLGSDRIVTPYNCFVSERIHDSMAGIMRVLTRAAETLRLGGGIGYDFSSLRPRGAEIKSLGSTASGPVNFMDVFSALCHTISSSGHRRGAQMGILRVDHPDIVEFVTAKQNTTRLTGFNLSVAVTDEFMHAVKNNLKFSLRFEGRLYERINARDLWATIMDSTWDWGEPGVIFIDSINKNNNLWYAETIEATNPCSEQPLPENGACLLSSLNLVKYLTNAGVFDYQQLEADVATLVRGLDMVIDNAIYPLPEQKVEAQTKRRMGIGVTGLANSIEAIGPRYGSVDFIKISNKILSTIANTAYYQSTLLAEEKGQFDLLNREKYCENSFIQKLHPEIKKRIKKYGIRNSHLTSVAPTGTISFCADYVSSGIEPTFSYEGMRKVIMPDGEKILPYSDYGYRELGIRGALSHDVTAQEHLDVLKAASYWSDSGVSKTVNMDSSMDRKSFDGIYMQAWEGGCKGCATFNASGKRMGIFLQEKEKAVPETDTCLIGQECAECN